ncbi:MAG: efflux RND transporter permease subunit, partial [Synergistales bacterium]|nr:efflux RND transporter permease subunit [Synergistales bacterium]
MEIVAPFKEVIEEIKESGGEIVKFCYQCGKCDTLCPWNKVRPFSVRRIVREATFGLTEIEREEIWNCTTCGRCPEQCPRGVKQIEAMVALRRIATRYGVFPAPVRPIRGVTAGLTAEGNPFGEERARRADWAKGLPVKTFVEGTDVLYFPGCYLSYDPRLKKVAAATAGILAKAGVDFGILGSQENCCGESIRKTGNETLFKRLARENIKIFIENGVKKIVVSSPHCYHTFKNEYPEFQVNFEVTHISQYLCELIDKGRLQISVINTLVEAMVLVFAVMFLFLQNFRYTLIPTLVVPVALMGTFAVMNALGFSINVLTLFGMVLAIGILVDDAIVVVENVERIMAEEGLPPKEATRKAMGQISGAIVGITLVLVAVFLPMAFMKGSVGVIYQQFSVSMAVSILFSAFLGERRGN